MAKINWIQKYRDYMKFLECDPPKKNITQAKARELLKVEIECIIAMNGEAELYDSERELLELLDMEDKYHD